MTDLSKEQTGILDGIQAFVASVPDQIKVAIGDPNPAEEPNEALKLIARIGIKRYNVMMNSQFAHGTPPRKWKHVGGRKRISKAQSCTKGFGGGLKRSRRSNS